MPSEEINMNIFKLDTTQMLSIPGNLSQIAVMPNAVWGIAPDSSVWVFVGTNNPLPPTPQFQNVPGTLASIAVGGDGSVWGLAQPPPTTQLDFDWPSITFGNGVPVGGNAHLTIHSDGTYTFSGHFHDSGATQYNMQLVWVVKDSTNTAYTFEHQGQVFGTFESGSRDDDWNNSGQNDEIKQNWANIVAGQTWKANADANGDLTNLLTTALAAVGVVLSVVGIVVSVVVVPPHP